MENASVVMMFLSPQNGLTMPREKGEREFIMAIQTYRAEFL